MNGQAATRHIREMGFQGVIIGVTGDLMDEDVKEFENCGADAVMAKPLDLKEFCRKIDHFLREKGVLFRQL